MTVGSRIMVNDLPGSLVLPTIQSPATINTTNADGVSTKHPITRRNLFKIYFCSDKYDRYRINLN